MESHIPDTTNPAGVIRQATLQLLRCVTICSGIHADKMQKEAIATLCGLLRVIVDAGFSPGLSKLKN